MRITLSAILAAMLAAAPSLAPDLRSVLSGDLHFSTAELADLDRGKIVKHSLPAAAGGEVAVVGAARVHARKDTFVERFRDIARFKRAAEVMEIGRFSDPPTMADFSGLTIDKEDFDARSCRVNDCGIRLPADTIRKFQREIDWKAADAEAHAAAMFKAVLLDNVRA